MRNATSAHPIAAASDPDQAGELLADAGLVDIAVQPTPPGTPALTVGRRATR